MIRNPEELTIAIKSAVNKRAVLVSHILLAFVIAIHTALWPAKEAYENALAGFLAGVILMILIIRFFDLAKINNRPLLSIVIYEIIIFIGLAFLTEPATPYILMPLLGAWLANVYYGAKGVYATVAMVGVATVVKYFVLSQERVLTTENVLDIFAAFFAFAAISSFYVNLQKVYDWDRTRLKSLIKEATIGQKRLKTLINNMTESVLVLDKNGVIKLYNAAALSLFDTNDSLEDKKLEDYAALEDEKGKKIEVGSLLHEEVAPQTRSDVILRYSEEDKAALSLTVTPLKTSFGDGDDYTGYIVTMRDITREKSLEEERNEFISVISHELRTPVTVTEASLSNALFITEKEDNEGPVHKALVTAHDQALYLANMLNDLTTFARAEKGTLELDIEDIKPNELLEQLGNDYRKQAEVKGMQLVIQAGDNLPETLTSNRLYIREILQNFITNAIKYSDKGTVTLSAHADEQGRVKFSVSDQGIGISTSDQKKVFDKFFRSEDFRTRSTSGTGLGLYIVHKLTKLLKAELGLESEVGKGSTFSLNVPNLPKPHQSAMAKALESETETGQEALPAQPMPENEEA